MLILLIKRLKSILSKSECTLFEVGLHRPYGAKQLHFEENRIYAGAMIKQLNCELTVRWNGCAVA